MSEYLLSYNERQNCKLVTDWYDRITKVTHSTRPFGDTNYDEGCLNSVNFYWQMANVMLQELMFAAEYAKKFDPHLQMYSVKKVHDECVECLKATRATIDDWLDENVETPTRPTVKELLAQYTHEELQQILREEMEAVGIDPDDEETAREMLKSID